MLERTVPHVAHPATRGLREQANAMLPVLQYLRRFIVLGRIGSKHNVERG
jgi:hypothetical protein